MLDRLINLLRLKDRVKNLYQTSGIWIMVFLTFLLPIQNCFAQQQYKSPDSQARKLFFELSAGSNFTRRITSSTPETMPFVSIKDNAFDLGYQATGLAGWQISEHSAVSGGLMIASRTISSGDQLDNYKENMLITGIPVYYKHCFKSKVWQWRVKGGLCLNYILNQKLDYSITGPPGYRSSGTIDMDFDRKNFIPEVRVGVGILRDIYQFQIGFDFQYFFGMRYHNLYNPARNLSLFEPNTHQFAYNVSNYISHGLILNIVIQR